MPKVKGIREYVDGIMSHEMVAPTQQDSYSSCDGLEEAGGQAEESHVAMTEGDP